VIIGQQRASGFADLLIFGLALDAHHFAVRRHHGQGDRSAAYAAIFDVLLTLDRAVDDYFDSLTAVGALDE